MELPNANEERIFTYMRDDRYKWTLAFYPDKLGTEYGRVELPQLDWKIKELWIHPCGKIDTSHWRLSLITHDGKRTFFNNSADYLYYGYGQMRVGPGKDENQFIGETPIAFKLELASQENTLEDYLKAALHPEVYGDNYDNLYEGQPMSWFRYTLYVTEGKNRECRHWVQAVARQFWRHKLLTADPTPILREKNKIFGYPSGEAPKGEFFKHKPAVWDGDPNTKEGLRLSMKGEGQQKALDRGDWNFEL